MVITSASMENSEEYFLKNYKQSYHVLKQSHYWVYIK